MILTIFGNALNGVANLLVEETFSMIKRCWLYLQVIRPQFSIAPAAKSATATRSAFDNGYDTCSYYTMQIIRSEASRRSFIDIDYYSS